MRRCIFWAMFALAAIGLALAARVAIAGENKPFKGDFTFVTPISYDGRWRVADQTGTASVVGDFSSETGVHFHNGFTTLEGYWDIAAEDGTLQIVFEQTGDFATGYWEGPFTIVGGTGRFAGASGSGTIATLSDLTTGAPLGGSFDGWISF